MSFAGDESQETENNQLQTKARWYAIQVASGCEKRVKSNIEQRIRSFNVADRVIQVQIPQTPTIKIRKDGSRQHQEEKVFPGYVLVEMFMEDDVWQVVKNTPHVINFVGSEQKTKTGRNRGHVKPIPLSNTEVERIFRQAEGRDPVVKINLGIGDKIMVLSGPFKDFHGEVIDVSPERQKLKALLSIFGRETPVELEFNQVEKES